ncbi:MAG: SCP2 sterol-binding domain-containing protein [Sporichthyaceae bacterium]|nr:SCP2 sterol-binding domain-containing protein [Sporichthyaceae bacterium]
MATLEECRIALAELAAQLGAMDSAERQRKVSDRSLSCRVPDLDVTFTGRLQDGKLVDIGTEPAERAQIRLTMNSDVLVALSRGEVGFISAWTSGRLKIDASLGDLLRLRTLF